jgi:hypothetical protein
VIETDRRDRYHRADGALLESPQAGTFVPETLIGATLGKNSPKITHRPASDRALRPWGVWSRWLLRTARSHETTDLCIEEMTVMDFLEASQVHCAAIKVWQVQ